jgi:polyhydroxybutyrate depolymerase
MNGAPARAAAGMIRDMTLRFFAAAMLSLAFAGAAYAQQPRRHVELQMLAAEHGGQTRSVGLYVPPSYSADRRAPLIIALHGRFSSAQAFHALSHLAQVADARGAILAYPETAGAFWNDGGHAALGRREPAADDAGFITTVIDALAQDYAIDRARVFLVGFDAGGSMAYRMACAGSPRLAGVAVVGALLWDFVEAACGQPSPTPMLIVHGRRDDDFPVRGGRWPGQGDAQRLGAEETVAVWREANGCGRRADASGPGGGALYTSCSSGAPVAFVSAPNGAHAWFREGPDYQLNRHDIDAAALVDSFFFDRAGFRLPERSGGRRGRAYIVYAPPNYDPATPTPVVVLLHGRPSSAAGMAAITQMNEVAARHGFIVVYPDGLQNQWNAFFDLVGQRSVLPQDDVGFLRTLMEDLRVDFNIDPARQYLGGFSNGAFMTHRMVCSTTDAFAAFAAVGAALYTVMVDECRTGRPAPILIMNGTGDPSIPYGGVETPGAQGGEPVRITLSVQETVAYFIRRNHCSLGGTSTTFAESGRSPGTHVIRFEPRDCDPGAEVVFYLVNGGGHNWPGVPDVLDEERFGPVNMDINAGEAIWDFFSRYRLGEPRS